MQKCDFAQDELVGRPKNLDVNQQQLILSMGPYFKVRLQTRKPRQAVKVCYTALPP